MGKGEDLFEAVRQQDVTTVNKIIHKGKSKLLGSSKKGHIINYQDSEGFSPLHQAAICGNPELICALLEAKADVDIKDFRGMRPLHYAAWQGKLEPVTILLTANARANVVANDGSTPLHLSAQYGHYSVSELLLQYGADPGLRNNKGKSSLDLTCEFGRLDVVELFLNSNGCASLLEPTSIDPKQTDVSTPLHLAASNGHKDIIRALLQTGIDINWTTNTGTCLHEAVTYGKAEVVRLLIDCGINVTKQNASGQTALELVHKHSDMSPETNSIRQMLTDAQPGSMKVRAIKDFKNVYDATSLAFKSGMLITVMEKNPNGNWKGKLRDPTTGHFKIGYFPAAYVEPQQHRHTSSVADGSDDSGIYPYHDDSQSSSSSPNTHYPVSTGITNRNDIAHVTSPRSPAMNPIQYMGSPHKYFNNMDQKLQIPQSQVPFSNPNVVNPSYEDVITSKRTSNTESQFQTNIPKTPVNSHINNPGYEDVLVQTSSGQPQIVPQNYSNTMTSNQMSYSQHPTANYHTNARYYHNQSGGNGYYVAANQVHHPPPHHDHHSDKMFRASSVKQPPNQPMKGMQKTRHNSTGSKQAFNVAQTQNTPANVANDKVITWLSSMGMQQYTNHFVSHGYDMPTISRMNPADLTAVGVTKPAHRKKISSQIAKLSAQTEMLNHVPYSVDEWCEEIGMPQYTHVLYNNGINSIDKVLLTTWEDLQEMKIDKLGHQKKLLLGISRLKQLMKSIEQHQVATTPDGSRQGWSPANRSVSNSKINPAWNAASPHVAGSMHGQDVVRTSPDYHSNNQILANMATVAVAKQHSLHKTNETIPERPKRLLPMSSFQENNDLSDELQKALNKRQHIINTSSESTKAMPSATPTSPSNQNNFKLNLKPVAPHNHHPQDKKENVPPPWASDIKQFTRHASDIGTGKNDAAPQRTPSVRGPKPPPPRRTCSSLSESESVVDGDLKHIENLKLQEPIEEDEVDLDPPVDGTSVGLNVKSIAAMLEPHKYTTPVQRIGRRSRTNSTKSPSSPLSPLSSTEDEAFVFPKPSSFKSNSKPPLANKPIPPSKPVSKAPVHSKPMLPTDKPQIFKKPIQMVEPNSHKPFPPAKKFDLSVLDKIGKKHEVSFVESQDNSSDEFDWPAPPPSVMENLPTTEVSSAREAPNTEMIQTSSVSSYETQPIVSVEQTRAVMRTPPTEPKTCFENDHDQGTVKRRPNSSTLVLNEDIPVLPAKQTKVPPLPPKDKPLPPTTKSAANKRMSDLDDILNVINSEIAICSSQSSATDDNNVPTLPPKHGFMNFEQNNNFVEDIALKKDQASDKDPKEKSAAQVLDDIGSMFADLELELDGLLN